jgi:AcrR family transcriptional regulator
LDEIANRAGVGNATLYRHFPTRRDLLVAVCVGEVDALCSHGNRLRTTNSAADALVEWLRLYVVHVSSKQGLAAALMTENGDDSAVITACHHAIAVAGSALLDAAQATGTIRPDLNLSDLLKLVNAVAVAAESDGAGQADRLLNLVLDGVRRR